MKALEQKKEVKELPKQKILADLRLTNLKLNFLEYIIQVGNNELLKSWLEMRFDPSVSEMISK